MFEKLSPSVLKNVFNRMLQIEHFSRPWTMLNEVFSSMHERKIQFYKINN